MGEGLFQLINLSILFPTVIFTVMLIVSLLFWLVAMLGAVDMDALDVDIELDDSGESAGSMAGILVKWGLNGVPFTIVVTLVALVGWIFSIVGSALLEPLGFSGPLSIAFDIGLLVLTFYVAVFITAILIRPLRKMFKAMDAGSKKTIVGARGIVRSSRVDTEFGEVIIQESGAELFLKARTVNGETLEKGDRILVIQHQKESDTYLVTKFEE